jgi:uncharacterized protein with PIN domain
VTDVEERRFVADGMLGSLARWLRIMGYDTTYRKDAADGELASSAAAESRTILTRDLELARAPNAFLVESDVLDEQLAAVVGRFGLAFRESETRCSGCNGELADASKDDVKGQVPDGAFSNNDRFWRCTSCGKIFWKGSHWIGITERLERLNLSASRDCADVR